jgi:hypothetical protein
MHGVQESSVQNCCCSFFSGKIGADPNLEEDDQVVEDRPEALESKINRG